MERHSKSGMESREPIARADSRGTVFPISSMVWLMVHISSGRGTELNMFEDSKNQIGKDSVLSAIMQEKWYIP